MNISNSANDNDMKPGIKHYLGKFLVLIIASLFVLQSAQAQTSAKNRNDVYQILNKLNSALDVPGIGLWINENAQEPVVNIGDVVYFTMKSSEATFYTLIHVDSKGGAMIIRPASTLAEESASDYIVYPPLVGGCREFKLSQHCFDEGNQLIQSDPIGQDAVFLLASKKPIPFEILGMNESENFKNLGKETSIIEKLVEQINSQANDNPISVVKYTYAVESTKTQYSTRSISKKVNRLTTGVDESLVFNNVNFGFNSSDLTVLGRVELDGLGSALVSLQEQLGELPMVELTGHTDSVGPEAYNSTLSMERAESAKQYLVSEYGLSNDAVRTAWKGESEPMDTNVTKNGRAINRRVVLKVISAQ